MHMYIAEVGEVFRVAQLVQIHKKNELTNSISSISGFSYTQNTDTDIN